MAKQIIYSVALAIKNESGQFLAVKRSYSDDILPGVWGLPAASLKGGEDDEAAIKRAGVGKLGVEVEIVKCIGEDTIDRGSYITILREYEVVIKNGEPSVPQSDMTVSQYVDWQYSDDPTLLFEVAKQGSLCSRTYLRSLGIDWNQI